jgi:hypothetical protein
LPYNDNLKRRVVYQRPPPDPVVIKPRNVILKIHNIFVTKI